MEPKPRTSNEKLSKLSGPFDLINYVWHTSRSQLVPCNGRVPLSPLHLIDVHQICAFQLQASCFDNHEDWHLN